MDAAAFDRVSRTWSASPSRRRVVRMISGLAVAGPIAAIGLPTAGARRKKRKKQKKGKNTRCTPNCADRTCGSDGCGGECGQCAGNQVCLGGSCCTPDPLAATCFHRCGTATNNCGQATLCPPCSGGRQCLSNGTCAIACGTSAECTATCGCTPSVDGPAQCVASGGACTDFPQTCTSTADCPAGQHCEETGCGPGPSLENRCVALC